MYAFLAIIIWLVINYFYWWFEFNPLLCFLWWLFLVMPSLLKFKLSDLKILFDKKYRLNVLLNFIFWFIIIPSIFFFVWYLFFWNSAISYAMMFLWLLPWWWMLFNLINKNWWDIKIWASLFIFNLILFVIIFFPLNHFLSYSREKIKNTTNENQISNNVNNLDFLNKLNEKNEKKHCLIADIWKDIKDNVSNWWACPIEKTTLVKCNMWDFSINPMAIIVVLVIIPFLISRIILFSSQKITNFLIPKISIISQIALFFIILYIFTLKDINPIFSVELTKLFLIFIWLFVSYFIVYLILYFVFFKLNKWINNDIKVSLFLNLWVRFLTMWLVFSFIYIEAFWIDFILVIAISYLVQPIFTIIFSNFIKKWLIR